MYVKTHTHTHTAHASPFKSLECEIQVAIYRSFVLFLGTLRQRIELLYMFVVTFDGNKKKMRKRW